MRHGRRGQDVEQVCPETKKGMDLYIPRHKNSDSGYSRPLSSDLRDQIKLKHYWWRTYMKTKRNEDFIQYKK